MHGDEVRWRPTVLPWQVPFRTRCRPKNRAFLVNEPRYILSRLTIISGILMASFVPHEFYILERNIYYQICKFSITIFKKLIFSCFSPYMCGILETQERFPRTYFTHKTPYAYLSLFTDCWNIQENLDSDLFWAGRFFGGFPFSFWRHGTRLATFLIAPTNCIFWDASFAPPPKDAQIALWSATNGSIPDFLYWLVVNPSLLRLLSTNILASYWPELNFNIKVTKILHHRSLSLD